MIASNKIYVVCYRDLPMELSVPCAAFSDSGNARKECMRLAEKAAAERMEALKKLGEYSDYEGEDEFYMQQEDGAVYIYGRLSYDETEAHINKKSCFYVKEFMLDEESKQEFAFDPEMI